MNIIVTGIHLDITEAIKSYAEKKAEKLVKYFDNISKIKFNLSVEHTKSNGERHVANVLVVASKTTLKAQAIDKNLYAAIDEVIDMLETQIKKHKDKLKNRQHHKFTAKEMVIEGVIGSSKEVEDDLVAHDIVETKLVFPKPISVEEALLQLQTLGKSFYAFMNAETEELNVVYLTKEHKYGLIEPAWN